MHKTPKSGLGWESHPVPVGGIGAAAAFVKGRTVVISSYAETRWPDESGEGPHWVISISQKGSPCAPDSVCRSALRQFGAPEAFDLEENHAPGISRCFFLPVDLAKREQCHCQAAERIVTEPSGRRWAKKVDA